MPYPPQIDAAHFPEPPAAAVAVQACPGHLAQPELTELWLTPNSHAARPAPYAAVHAPIDAGIGARYVMVPATATTLGWTITNPQFVATTKIEIVRRSPLASLPLFTRTITWNANACPGAGDLPFPVALVSNAAVALANAATVVDAVNAGMAAAFPSNHLNIEWAPYKLRVTLTDNRPYTVARGVAWIYLDVVAHSIDLGYGDAAWVAANHRTVTRSPNNIPAAAGVVKVLVPSNLFSDNTRQWHEEDVGTGNRTGYDYPFERHLTAWGDGPQIPLRATIRVATHDGQGVESAVATAGSRLLWDAEDAKVAELHTTPLIAAGVNDNETSRNDVPGWNCHTAAGGLRGAAVRVLPAQAANPAEFPFDVTNAGVRPGASRTAISAAGATAGVAGLIFRPSRMGGDAYRLRARWLYDPGRGDGVTQLDAVAEVAPTIELRTGVFQVWRAVNLRTYSRRTAGADRLAASLAAIRAAYAPAYIELIERANPATVVLGTYHTDIMAIVGARSPVLQAAVLDNAAWRAGAYAMHFNSYEHVLGAIGGAALLVYFGPGGPDEGQRRAHGLEAADLPRMYEDSLKGWAQALVNAIVPAVVHADPGVNIIDFDRLYVRETHNAPAVVSLIQAVQGYAPLVTGMTTKGCFINMLTDDHYVTLSAETQSQQTFALTAAHELGHTLYLCHAPGGGAQRQGAGIEVAFHAANMGNCLMGYHELATDFCAVCLLRLRGWRRSALIHDDLPAPSTTSVFFPADVTAMVTRPKIVINITDFLTGAGVAGNVDVTCTSVSGRIVRTTAVPQAGLTIRIAQTDQVRAALRITFGPEVMNAGRLLLNDATAWNVAMRVNKPTLQFGPAMRVTTLAIAGGGGGAFDVDLTVSNVTLVTATDTAHANVDFETNDLSLLDADEGTATVASNRFPITFTATDAVTLKATVGGDTVRLDIP